MSWWTYIPAALSGANALWSSSQQAEGAQTQNQWETFNASMSYLTNQRNIETQNALAAYNASLVTQMAGIDAGIAIETSEYNAEVIAATTMYNDQLYEQELAIMWEQAGLDQFLLAQQRARERGGMVATQASSGTLINDGSNAKIIVDQRTQENIDSLVIQRGADIKATNIANARAKSKWEGQMAVQKTLWEGQLGSYKTIANAEMQANSILTEQALASDAANWSNRSQFFSDSFGASSTLDAKNQGASNTLFSGLFGAASSGVDAYFRNEASLLS